MVNAEIIKTIMEHHQGNKRKRDDGNENIIEVLKGIMGEYKVCPFYLARFTGECVPARY